MSIHIDPLPKIPEALRVAASTRRLVPFIGAGVSQLGGSPGWDEFANLALKFFVTHGKLSHAALDQIMGLTSRVIVSPTELEVRLRANGLEKMVLELQADRLQVNNEEVAA